jgi:hypothetical protein
MKAVIAILALALAIGGAEAAPAHKQHQTCAQKCRDAKKQITRKNWSYLPRLILGIGY